jgi:hypothetical protein
LFRNDWAFSGKTFWKNESGFSLNRWLLANDLSLRSAVQDNLGIVWSAAGAPGCAKNKN